MAPLPSAVRQHAYLAIAAIAIARRRKRKRHTKGREWARPHIMDHASGTFTKLIPLLREREPDQFRNFVRMPPAQYDTLIELVTSHIKKEDTQSKADHPPFDWLINCHSESFVSC